MRISSIAITLASLVALPTFADSRADATSIVNATVTEEIFQAGLAAQAPLISSALVGQFSQLGITISDPDKFTQIIGDAMAKRFVGEMREVTIDFYVDNFTDEQLAGIAGFYASPEGQALISKTPQLLQFGADEGMRIGMQIGAEIGPLIADEMEESGVVLDEDPSKAKQIIDILRNK